MNIRGIGMTSQRTRERLVERLFEQGISDIRVIEMMRTTPRHLSVSYTHLRAHETVLDLVCRLLLEQKTPTDRERPRLFS